MVRSISEAYKEALAKNAEGQDSSNAKLQHLEHVKEDEGVAAKPTAPPLSLPDREPDSSGRNDKSERMRSTGSKRRPASGGLILPSLLPGVPRKPIRPVPVQKPRRTNSVPHYQHLRDRTVIRAEPPPAVPATAVKLSPHAKLVWNAGYQDGFPLLNADESDGTPEQMPGTLGRDREMIIGLDFGTSSVKLVVNDRGASKAYAVPFASAAGVNAYLLPSRLFEENGTFSLLTGSTVHRDLKLRFLANPHSSQIQESIVGFLALVIRRCRAWLFKEHAEALAKRTIFWKLVLGRAIDRSLHDPVAIIMSDLLSAAWVVAGHAGAINRLACAKSLASHRNHATPVAHLPEVCIVPELAAQIYGFVKSRQFDPRDKNFYLFVDVGAGTVDVSLFRVKQTAYGTWDFSLFTSVVQPNGVVNLHRHRLDWWRKQFARDSNPQCVKLLEEVSRVRMPTEQTLPIPVEYLDYFKGIDVQYGGGALSPDETFYDTRLISQVRGQGLKRPVDSRFVGQVDLDNLPYFLCGGGARLPLYQNLATGLNQPPGLRWLKAHRRELGIPSELVAPGLARGDYDRLSVAFGLSSVDVGSVAVAEAMPKINQQATADWTTAYLDKDQV